MRMGSNHISSPEMIHSSLQWGYTMFSTWLESVLSASDIIRTERLNANQERDPGENNLLRPKGHAEVISTACTMVAGVGRVLQPWLASMCHRSSVETFMKISGPVSSKNWDQNSFNYMFSFILNYILKKKNDESHCGSEGLPKIHCIARLDWNPQQPCLSS